jgi:DinB superfamily
MTHKTLIDDLTNAIDHWIEELDRYTLIELCTKPSSAGWSLGQVCLHLVKNTRYYIEQAKICSSVCDHMCEEPSAEALKMFMNNAFPDAIIEGPDTNTFIPQPASKEELKNALLSLKDEINSGIISNNIYEGKTRHPGLGYFSADQWLQFADMHLRHHLRQKKRIDDFFERK